MNTLERLEALQTIINAHAHYKSLKKGIMFYVDRDSWCGQKRVGIRWRLDDVCIYEYLKEQNELGLLGEIAINDDDDTFSDYELERQLWKIDDSNEEAA